MLSIWVFALAHSAFLLVQQQLNNFTFEYYGAPFKCVCRQIWLLRMRHEWLVSKVVDRRRTKWRRGILPPPLVTKGPFVTWQACLIEESISIRFIRYRQLKWYSVTTYRKGTEISTKSTYKFSLWRWQISFCMRGTKSYIWQLPQA